VIDFQVFKQRHLPEEKLPAEILGPILVPEAISAIKEVILMATLFGSFDENLI